MVIILIIITLIYRCIFTPFSKLCHCFQSLLNACACFKPASFFITQEVRFYSKCSKKGSVAKWEIAVGLVNANCGLLYTVITPQLSTNQSAYSIYQLSQLNDDAPQLQFLSRATNLNGVHKVPQIQPNMQTTYF